MFRRSLLCSCLLAASASLIAGQSPAGSSGKATRTREPGLVNKGLTSPADLRNSLTAGKPAAEPGDYTFYPRYVSPQVVAGRASTGEQFATRLDLLNTSNQTCEVQASIGPNSRTFNDPVLVNGQPFQAVLNLAAFAQGEVLIRFDSTEEAFQGGVILRAPLNCLSNLSVGTTYMVEKDGQLREVFSYEPAHGVPPGSCFRAPVRFGQLNAPQSNSGSTQQGNKQASAIQSTPGLALQGNNTIPGGQVCTDLLDTDGNQISSTECFPFDGTHQVGLLPTFFPEAQPFDGIWQVCNASATNPSLASNDFYPLFIDVVQQGDQVQFGTIPGQLTGGICHPDATTLCLLDGRFQVKVDFSDPQQPAQAAGVQPDGSGLFYFTNPDNWEMLVKLVDGCNTPDPHYWVFFASTTNVEYTLTVTDTGAGETKVYTKPQSAPAVTDIEAFATCP